MSLKQRTSFSCQLYHIVSEKCHRMRIKYAAQIVARTRGPSLTEQVLSRLSYPALLNSELELNRYTHPLYEIIRL